MTTPDSRSGDVVIVPVHIPGRGQAAPGAGLLEREDQSPGATPTGRATSKGSRYGAALSERGWRTAGHYARSSCFASSLNGDGGDPRSDPISVPRLHRPCTPARLFRAACAPRPRSPALLSRAAPMPHLELVALVVRDYDPAIAFFVDTLGFELIEDSPSLTNDGRPKRWVVVRPQGAVTGILLARADGPGQEALVGRQFAGRVGFFLSVDDFDAAHARLVAAGVTFATPPRAEAYGRVAVFEDIEGNRWDLLGPRLP